MLTEFKPTDVFIESGATAVGKITATLRFTCVYTAVYPCKPFLMDLGKQWQPSTLTAAAAFDLGKHTLGFRLLKGTISDREETKTALSGLALYSGLTWRSHFKTFMLF